MYKLKDNKIIFSRKFKPEELESISSGANAKIYKINLDNKDYALKIFYDSKLFTSDELDQKSKINIKSFISPKKLFYLNHKLKGYTMKLCKGKSLNKQKLDITIKDFIKYATKLLNDTDRLSKLDYVVDDLSLDNLMLDNGFRVVDIDFFEPYSEEMKNKITDICKYNNLEMVKLLVNLFIKNTNLTYEFVINDKLRILNSNCISGKISFFEFLDEVFFLTYGNNKFKNITIEKLGNDLKSKLNIKKNVVDLTEKIR